MEGKGTGWCTAGRSTAETQIEDGDFYVYYTNDASGTPSQPRLAIRMDGTDRIGEVRGILPHQGVEPIMQETLDAKLAEFGSEADVYRKKSEDMRRLTSLERKREQGDSFSKDDLIFLYEINAPIEGFGYQVNGKCSDPRVAEFRASRNVEEDMPVVLECTSDQIARSTTQVNERTKAYVGKLEPGIFDKLPEGIEYIYTSFPEGRIRRERLDIGGKTNRELEEMLISSGFQIGSGAEFMLRSKEFTSQENPEEISLVRLQVRDLGFTSFATAKDLFERAAAFGLELCPAEAAPHYRLKYTNQPMGEWLSFAMQPIAGQDGNPSVFMADRDEDGSRLDNYGTGPYGRWDANGELMFRLRKKA